MSDPVSEVLEVQAVEHRVTTAAPELLFDRWETETWSVPALRLGEDLPIWTELPAFARTELTGVLEQLLTGETCVTETLTPLIELAPNVDQQLFLATQLADEARHVRFFRAYRCEVVGLPGAGDGDAYGRHFAPTLKAATRAVREHPEDCGRWYEALAHYHLATEAVLAATALRSTLRMIRRMDVLPRLLAGLVHVARDESRHVQFGTGAVQAGVDAGYGDRIADCYLTAVELAARVIIDPERRIEFPPGAFAKPLRQAQLHEQWDFARRKMLRNLAATGLQSHSASAADAWIGATRLALDDYHTLWETEHPLAAAVGNV
ncbi:MAG: ferritin family protein [Solirubrobacteraceae bacterium]